MYLHHLSREKGWQKVTVIFSADHGREKSHNKLTSAYALFKDAL